MSDYNLFSGIIPTKILEYVMGLNKIKFLLLMCSTFLMLSILTSSVIELIITEIDISIPFLKGATLGRIFFYSVVIAPLIETLVFQYIILDFLPWTMPEKNIYKWIAIIMSAALFGLSHYYSLEYIIYGTVMGLFLAITYVIAKFKNLSAFFTIWLIHTIINLLAFAEQLISVS